MKLLAPLSPWECSYPPTPAGGAIPFAAKSGKDKTAYMLFGTRWKVAAEV